MHLRKADISDSTQIWSSSLPNDYSFGSNPVIDEDGQMVYAYTSTINGLLMAAFDLATGEFLWLQPGNKPIADLGTYRFHFLGSYRGSSIRIASRSSQWSRSSSRLSSL